MVKLSVLIITYNEEKMIGRCLVSVKDVADEIVVVDSLSTDKTKEICLSYGVRFYEQSFLGYIEQKNFAMDKASNQFVLSLDADESLSDELASAIRAEKENGFYYDAYIMNRFNNYCGKWIRHGDYYPDRKIRIWNKDKGSWGGMNPHDKVVFGEAVQIKQLEGAILHYSFFTYEEHVEKMNRFSTIAAEDLFKKGKKKNYLKLVINPVWSFIRGYFFRAGFLDGKEGFIIARTNASYTFQKYLKLIKLNRQKAAIKNDGKL